MPNDTPVSAERQAGGDTQTARRDCRRCGSAQPVWSRCWAHAHIPNFQQRPVRLELLKFPLMIPVHIFGVSRGWTRGSHWVAAGAALTVD